MKRHRHTPEQVVRKLREGGRLLNEGKDLLQPPPTEGHGRSTDPQVTAIVRCDPRLHGQQEWLTESLSCSRDASQELTWITVPTSLIWGRHDRVMRLRIAQAASARYGWPLHVIEDAGHFLIEQPEAFRAALQAALGDR